MKRWIIAIACSLALTACSEESETAPTAQPGAVNLFAPGITTVSFEVDYASNAEPYTGGAGPMFADVWELFDHNAQVLLGNDKQILVPHTLDGMQELTDLNATQYSSSDILSIAANHWDEAAAADKAQLYAIWLDGYFFDGQTVRQDVLGVSIGTTGVIAMFKPVISSGSSGGVGQAIAKYVEQATLVHEFGHAAGLVNNGLAMTAAHEDADHPAHCNHSDCVMYYAVEGVSGITSFVQKYVTTKDSTLWGQSCLADSEAARATP